MRRRRSGGVLALLAAVLLLLVAATGCNRDGGTEQTGREPVPALSSEELFDKIIELQRSKTSAPLRSLTDFEWDGVYCYYEGASTDKINADVGGEVEEPGRRLAVSGALAVFVHAGRPVRKATIPELTFKIRRYSSDVVVREGFALAEPTEQP